MWVYLNLYLNSNICFWLFQYYICYNGEPHLEKCLSGMFWSQPLHQCIPSSTADITSCKLPGT